MTNKKYYHRQAWNTTCINDMLSSNTWSYVCTPLSHWQDIENNIRMQDIDTSYLWPTKTIIISKHEIPYALTICFHQTHDHMYCIPLSHPWKMHDYTFRITWLYIGEHTTAHQDTYDCKSDIPSKTTQLYILEDTQLYISIYIRIDITKQVIIYWET